MILIFVITFIFLFYKYFSRGNDYWKKRGVPYDKPAFMLGNTMELFLGSKHMGVVYADMYKKFKNYPYVGMFQLNNPQLLINDPDIIQNILVKDFNHFASSTFKLDHSSEPILAVNPFFRTGEDWKISRGRWSSVVTSSRMRAMYACMTSKGDTLVEILTNRLGEDIDAEKLVSSFFIDVVVSSVFGVDINSTENPNNPFSKIATSLFVPTYWESLKTTLTLRLPFLGKILNMKFISKKNEEDLLYITREIIMLCKDNNLIKKEEYEKIKKEIASRGKASFVDYELTGMIFGYLLETTQTSSGLLFFALYEIAYNTKIQNRLRRELDEAANKCGGKISHDDLIRLPYLDMVISEVLRLYPQGTSLTRVCTKPYSMTATGSDRKTLDIPVGMTMVIPIYALHMDPQYFQDPETFDPKRFTEENKASRHKYVYLPFGEGPRICLGSRLGVTMSKIGIASILQNYEIRISPRAVTKPVKIDPRSLLYKPVGKILLTFHPRSV